MDKNLNCCEVAWKCNLWIILLFFANVFLLVLDGSQAVWELNVANLCTRSAVLVYYYGSSIKINFTVYFCNQTWWLKKLQFPSNLFCHLSTWLLGKKSEGVYFAYKWCSPGLMTFFSLIFCHQYSFSKLRPILIHYKIEVVLVLLQDFHCFWCKTAGKGHQCCWK